MTNREKATQAMTVFVIVVSVGTLIVLLRREEDLRYLIAGYGFIVGWSIMDFIAEKRARWMSHMIDRSLEGWGESNKMLNDIMDEAVKIGKKKQKKTL